jgi:hypothetical protein
VGKQAGVNMNKILASASNFIWKNARHLERAVFEFHFYDESPAHILEILRTYQNEDGGFGHAIEPDLRAPDSHPLFVEFALRTLYDCNLREPKMAYRACDFLSRNADPKQGIPTIFPSSKLYPRAAHMNNSIFEQPSLDRLTSLVGLTHWQGVNHPWLPGAVEVCLEDIANNRYTDAHTIMNAFCLLESLSPDRAIDLFFNKLSKELYEANFFCSDVPVRTYCLTPLTFAPSPNSFCRPIFSETQIEDHLTDLERHQEDDGGWPILWEPPGEMARREWRAYKTVMALITLHAYGRI